MLDKEYTLKGKLEKRTSSKGNEYTCLVLKIAPNYEKVVFLDKAEMILLENNK